MSRIGIVVTCAVCGRQKAPHGRSASSLREYCVQPYGVAGGFVGCVGYNQEPKVGCLWPGETSEDFGSPHCEHGTQIAEPGTTNGKAGA